MIALLIARILMPILFISAGYGKLKPMKVLTVYAINGVPGALLPLTILLELVD